MSAVENKVYSEDKYKITLASFLTDYDQILLTRLYQPLCGYGPLSLYLTFWVETKNNTIKTKKHKNILFITGMSIQEFEEYRNKLEGIGLLKTYLNNEDNTYVYELYAPLSAKDFFKHELLGTLLKQRLDNEEYEYLKDSFLDKSSLNENYINSSHNFTEVYNLDMNDTKSLKKVISNDSMLIERKNAEIKSDFNLDIFLLALKEKKIRKNIVNNELLETINLMVNLYKLNENQIAEILYVSLDKNSITSRIDLDIFKQKCAKYKKMPTPTPAIHITSKKSIINKKIEMLNELEPIEFLKFRRGDLEKIATKDKKLIDDLRIISKLNDGVINVLLDYVLIKQDNVLHRPYVMKIASSLFENDIETTKEAMEYFYKIKNYTKNKNNEIEETNVVYKDSENKKEEVNYEKEAEELKRMKKLLKERDENGKN